jgi:hypothetical protein
MMFVKCSLKAIAETISSITRVVAPPSPTEVLAKNSKARNRDGFQMVAGWMCAGVLRPGRRLKAPEEGNRGQRRSAMEI